MTKNRSLKVGDVVDSVPLGCYPDIVTVVVHVGGPCESHSGKVFLIVHDFDAHTGKSTGAESDWCDVPGNEPWTVTGQRPDLAQLWADENREDV